METARTSTAVSRYSAAVGNRSGVEKEQLITLKQLRHQAIATTLFPPTTLRTAVQRLGFVQADPIRSPARAQDLILRHRVKNYHAGDLERLYPTLHLEEDLLYAYGFMPESTWSLLHPRDQGRMSAAEKRVLSLLSLDGTLHPRDLEAHLGREREMNAWGGYSKATTRTLQRLHYRGSLRISARENGIRLYERVTKQPGPLTADERLRGLILLIAAILAPISERSLRAALKHLAHAAPNLEGRYSMLTSLITSGELASALVDEVRYLWPAERPVRKKPADVVRFLAPFDPLVWDRRRFEHLWGWPYRFEAYTPAAKRKLGYYAMPMLYGDDVLGWVNVSTRQGQLRVEPGFVRSPSNQVLFEREYDAEVERFRAFLKTHKDPGGK